MNPELYGEAGKALEAVWPSHHPSPPLTAGEVIEIKATLREVTLEEWGLALRKLADDGRRLRPHPAEIRAACKVEIMARRPPPPPRRTAPTPNEREENLAKLAEVRGALEDAGKAP